MTNLEGRVLRRRKAVDPPAGVRTELFVLRELAARLGCTARFSDDAAQVFEELGRASAGGRADYSGLSHELLDGHPDSPKHWPVPVGSGGNPRLFADRFAHPDGLARPVSVAPGAPADDLRPDAPVYLVTGRVLAQYQSGAQTRRVTELNRAAAGPFVELHPQLAARLRVQDGEPVTVTSQRGMATAPARISSGIRPDTVFMPFHWAGPGSANAVTSDATDPVSGMPEFKVCAVSVTRGVAGVMVEESA
jgi:assimilatory nitrate reductase catalytic subunit